MTPTINTYFSGIGVGDAGLIRAGINIGQSFEIDPTAHKVQKENLGDHAILADLTKTLVLDEIAADGAVFTYPCTKYSAIADIHGSRTGDDLFLHALRRLAIARPEVYAVENVPGMRKFPIVMESMTKMPDYYIQVFCPIQSSTWLPQRRDRLIILGSKKPFNWNPPSAGKLTSLADILEKDPRVTLPAAIRARMTGKYRDLPIISDPKRGDIAPTCIAHYAKDKSTRLVADIRFPMGVRPYSVREWARLQGLPDSFTFNCSDTDAYRGIGNGVSEPVGHWLGTEFKRYFNRTHTNGTRS